MKHRVLLYSILVLATLSLIQSVSALVITDCLTTVDVNETSNLSSNIHGPGNCLVINASDIVLDCHGFSLNGTTGRGINASNQTNITIQNCFVQNFTRDIEIVNMGNSSILNNTIFTALSMQGIDNNQINNNTINTFDVSTNAISMTSGSNNNTFIDNNLTSRTNPALAIATESSNNTFTNNFVAIIAGTVPALRVTGASDNTFTNILAIGTNGGGINITSTATVKSLNNVLTNVTGKANLRSGIGLHEATGTRLTDCTAISTTGDALSLSFNTNGTNITGLKLYSNTSWIFATEDGLGNTMENTTFEGINGSINFLPIVNITNGSDLTMQTVNVTHNFVFVDTTTHAFLNVSSIISLTGITNNVPVLRADFEDNGSFETCPDTVCTQLAFVDNTLNFSVTGFTSYSNSESDPNITLSKSEGQDPVDSSRELNYSITITNNGVGNASNISLTETYPAEVFFINSTPLNISGNNTFIIGNLSPGESFTLNITVFTNNLSAQASANNTVNITYQNTTGGVNALSVSEITTINAIPSTPSGSTGGSGGGGGGGGVRRRTTTENTTVEACFESWACGGWSTCINGVQTRECADLRACGTTALKPYESQICNVKPLPEPEVVAEPELPEPIARATDELPVVEEKSGRSGLFGVVIIALILLAAYLYLNKNKLLSKLKSK